MILPVIIGIAAGILTVWGFIGIIRIEFHARKGM
jgi:hypothetical protein